MHKLVKGATKPKAAAPKAKYIEPLLETTFESNPRNFEAAMDGLQRTLSKGSTWTTTYKALIVVHIFLREGKEDVTLRHISRHPRMLDLDEEAGRGAVGLMRYARYLTTRATQFKDTRVDYVRYRTRLGHGRLHSLSIDKGLLREAESVIVQVDSLLKCHFDEQDVSNDVVLMAFRLLVHDLLSLFQVLNEGVINILETFFELSRVDAEHALEIYKGFTRLTSKVIGYLKTAKNLEYQTKLKVPNIKYAPTSLVSSLEMYLSDPDFETNRRQYLAEKQAHDKPSSQRRERESFRVSTDRNGRRSTDRDSRRSLEFSAGERSSVDFAVRERLQSKYTQPSPMTQYNRVPSQTHSIHGQNMQSVPNSMQSMQNHSVQPQPQPQPQQPQQQPQQQQPQQPPQQQPSHGQTRPYQVDLLTGDAPEPTSQINSGGMHYNPFLSQELSQMHATQIQLEQSQAQYQQQLIEQQQQQQLLEYQRLTQQVSQMQVPVPVQSTQPSDFDFINSSPGQQYALNTGGTTTPGSVYSASTVGSPLQAQHTNPFKNHPSAQATPQANPFARGKEAPRAQQPIPTGTNPFRNSLV